MALITLEIEDSLIESIGESQIETLVLEWLEEYKRKQSLKEAFNDLSSIDLTNDPKWQAARNLAWETYKHNFDN